MRPLCCAVFSQLHLTTTPSSAVSGVTGAFDRRRKAFTVRTAAAAAAARATCIAHTGIAQATRARWPARRLTLPPPARQICLSTGTLFASTHHLLPALFRRSETLFPTRTLLGGINHRSYDTTNPAKLSGPIAKVLPLVLWPLQPAVQSSTVASTLGLTTPRRLPLRPPPTRWPLLLTPVVV